MVPRIADLVSGMRVDAAYLAVVEARTLLKRDGTPYVRGRLRDATGTIAAVAWDNVETCRTEMIVGRVVKVRGQVGRNYSGDGIELTIEKIRLAEPDEYDPTHLLRCSTRDRAQLLDELRCMVDSLRPPLRDVVLAAIEPEMDRFARWPAAEEVHHAWLGGLLEHSVEVARLCEAIVQVIPGADRDLVVAGALLHDVGKLDTYQVGAAFDATDDGRLLGHVLTGFYRVRNACTAACAPPDVALHLLHIVASHHGTLERGAAREPATREAIVVHYADELSSQLMEATEAIRAQRDPSARWTERAKGLKRDIFIGTHLTESS